MDEADLTLHPAWQVEFISNITYFFPKILPDKHLKLQIFFTTHSPILLGDMPRQNVIYMDKKAEIKLSIEPKPINIYKNKDVSVCERIELEKRIQTSVNRLHLEDLYNMHTDYAAQIIRNRYLFNDAYIKMLSERFPKMKFSMHDVKEFMYCKDLNEENWGQNILAKLAHDMDTETNS